MNYFPYEIIDHILYFTRTKLYILIKVNKYFRQNILRIRLENTIDIDSFEKLFRITILNIFRHQILTYGYSNYKSLCSINGKNDPKITDEILFELINLRFLILHNGMITDKGISNLTNLKFLGLPYNNNITDKGLGNLTNLTKLSLEGNSKITDKGLYHLTKLVKLDLWSNRNITNKGLKKLTNLTSLNLIDNKTITNDGVSRLINLKILYNENSNVNRKGIAKLPLIQGFTEYNSEEDEKDNYKG